MNDRQILITKHKNRRYERICERKINLAMDQLAVELKTLVVKCWLSTDFSTT